MTELVYARGTRSAAEVQQDIDRFWDRLDDSDVVQALAEAGVDRRDLPPAGEREKTVQVSALGAGLDPTAVALIVAFAPTANEILITVWTQVILPRIRRRYGRDAVGDQRPPDA
ncbi:hypothetical protein [Actinoplanes sp. NPDC026670]|uniref:hypothetical protein n=1 Tax=Actinoplanes sp. NPDC026670 TaxID=3154700 RepID=UPI0033F3DBCD